MTKTKAKAKAPATKKRAAPAPAEPTLPYTTIRMIEDQQPCSGEYRLFLRDFKANPISRYIEVQKIKNPAIGPDTPILLSDILTRKSSSGGMNGCARVDWLLGRECIGPKTFSKTYAALEMVSHLVMKLAVTLDAETIKRLVAL